jgi:hypothetical protein
MAQAHLNHTNGKGNIHSTKVVSDHLMQELISAMKDVDAFGSVEIMIQDYAVTQITHRCIRKTNGFHEEETIKKMSYKIHAEE